MIAITLTKDTPIFDGPAPNDPQAIGSGDATAPGGKDASEQGEAEMTHGEAGYPGQQTDDKNSER